MITTETIGRRTYLRNTPYEAKDRLRDAGGKWDPHQRAWWFGKREAAEALASALSSASAAPAKADRSVDDSAAVAGKAAYKGRTYYVAGRVRRERSGRGYEESVAPVTSRDSAKVLLYSRDGSLSFWAPLWPGHNGETRISASHPPQCPPDQAELVKVYNRPQTIGGLRRYAEGAKLAREQGYGDGVPVGARYTCGECGEYVSRGGGGRCWETGAAH